VQKLLSIRFILIYILIMMRAGFCQDEIKEMRVTEFAGENIVADKGNIHGVMKDAVYDIQRILPENIRHIGIAIVTEIKETTCVLKAYPSGKNKIKAGDFLILNPTTTQSLRQTQQSEFWENIQKENMKSDDLSLKDGKSYKNARVILSSGKIITGKNFIVKGTDELLFPSPLRIKPEVVFLKDVEAIQASTKRYAPQGSLIGVALTGTVVLIDELKNKPEKEFYYKTVYHRDIYGNITRTVIPATRKIDNRISPTLRTVIIGGGFVVGGFFGSLVKGGWKIIYPNQNKDNKLSLNIFLLDNSFKTPALSINYRF